MGWENKVVWSEGLFLQPQHLQQQERYFDRLVRGSTAGLRPFGWGLTQLDIDTDLLALGKFAVRSHRRHPARRHAVQRAVRHRLPDPARPARGRAEQPGLSAAADPPARRRGDRAARADGDRGALRHGRA